MSQPQPRGRCPLLKLCPMGSLGEAGGPVISHQKQVWTSPHQGTGAPRRPPQQDFNLGRTGKKFSFSFFFYHTKMLLILNLLILSVLLVTGEEVAGMPLSVSPVPRKPPEAR